MKHFKRTSPLVLLVLFVSIFITAVSKFLAPVKHSSMVDVKKDASFYADIAVDKVFDGDTIKLANGEKVRLIGIDTPESSENKKLFRDAQRSGNDTQVILRMGRLAAEYTHQLLDSRRVRLEFDIEKRDKYGRLLAYVYRVSDGMFINAEIIKNGYAYPLSIPPNIRHADEFRKLFRDARRLRLGLWAKYD